MIRRNRQEFAARGCAGFDSYTPEAFISRVARSAGGRRRAWNRVGGSTTHAGRARARQKSTRGAGLRSFSFLEVAGRIGRAAAAFLIASNFVFLIAPLLYFTVPTVRFDPVEPSGATLIMLSDPYRIFALGDVFVLIGAALLAGAVLLILLDRKTRSSKSRRIVIPLGVAALAFLLAWFVATAYAQGRSRGGGVVDAVAATGGWGIAAASLLVASLLYVVFVWRLEGRKSPSESAPVRWPVFAAFNLIGTGALAALVGSGSMDPFFATMGLALGLVLIPLLGIVTYRDVWDSFGKWLPADGIDAGWEAAPAAPLHLGRGTLAAPSSPPESLEVPPPPPPDD